MITRLATAAVSNSCFALVLALVALTAGRQANHPRLVHLLWVLVLAKLVAPPWILASHTLHSSDAGHGFDTGGAKSVSVARRRTNHFYRLPPRSSKGRLGLVLGLAGRRLAGRERRCAGRVAFSSPAVSSAAASVCR